eukprot:201420-Alexandrium_andersonii.AAC.1
MSPSTRPQGSHHALFVKRLVQRNRYVDGIDRHRYRGRSTCSWSLRPRAEGPAATGSRRRPRSHGGRVLLAPAVAVGRGQA